MATTPVDSGGIQSTPSPMVAVPGAKEAPVILGTGIGMAMPKMECKINLRGGNQDAWRRWLVNRNDVITAHGLDALMDNQLVARWSVNLEADYGQRRVRACVASDVLPGYS